MKALSGGLVVICLIVCFYGTARSQSVRLPRDPQKLIDRATTFWNLMITGQRAKALDFVVADKRDAFVAASSLPILGAKVIGLDFTSDPNHGIVRVRLDSMSVQVTGTTASFTVNERWIFKNGNWYVEVGDPRDLSPNVGLSSSVPEMIKQIEQSLRLPKSEIDMGTVIEGAQVNNQVPIEYTGKFPLTVELATAMPVVSVHMERGRLTESSSHFILSFDSGGWEGPVSIPVNVRFRFEAAVVERTVLVRGSVFAPITFRQVPPTSAQKDGRFSVFIRNNTSEKIDLQYISVDGKLDVLKDVRVLEPQAETETIFRPKPGEKPGTLTIVPSQPVHGKNMFAFRFRI